MSISHRKAKEKQAQQTLYQGKNHPQNKHPEYQHSTYKKRQTKAFASPRRTARETSDSAERVSGVRPRIIVYRNRKGIAGRTMFAPTDFRFQCSAGGVSGGQDRIRFSGAFPCAKCPFQQEINRIAPVFHISFNSVWKTQREKKSHLSSSFASPENLRCGICCGGLWNEISTTCAKYDTMRQGFPRNSPQTFPFHSTIFPLFHAEKTSPLFRILSTNVLWGKSPRNFR